jgi:hypothetical protein
LNIEAIEAMKTKPEKPLFIPLKAEYFEAFESGGKRTEYRLSGPRWNAETCRMGRRGGRPAGAGQWGR